MDLEIKAMCETKVKADMEEAEKGHSQFLIYSLEINDRMSVKNKNFFLILELGFVYGCIFFEWTCSHLITQQNESLSSNFKELGDQ